MMKCEDYCCLRGVEGETGEWRGDMRLAVELVGGTTDVGCRCSPMIVQEKKSRAEWYDFGGPRRGNPGNPYFVGLPLAAS
jgi:hypothetical protein